MLIGDEINPNFSEVYENIATQPLSIKTTRGRGAAGGAKFFAPVWRTASPDARSRPKTCIKAICKDVSYIQHDSRKRTGIGRDISFMQFFVFINASKFLQKNNTKMRRDGATPQRIGCGQVPPKFSPVKK